jgi:hypothetical protein
MVFYGNDSQLLTNSDTYFYIRETMSMSTNRLP